MGTIYGELDLPRPKAPDLPLVLVNMVTSVDGRSAVAGKASGLGSVEDRRVMRILRSLVDAVMVGAGTLRAEKLKLGLDEPCARQPLAVIVGGAGEVPVERLIRGNQEILVATPAGAPTEEVPLVRVLEVQADEASRLDLASLLATLRREHDVERLLVEGGPSLNRGLLDADLVDEIFLTVAPKLVFGDGPSIVSHTPNASPRGLELLSVHAAGSELFLRYRVMDQ